ncbi:beta/alpha barrel domain-containing protein [Aminipila luticellarii]|uniref:Hydroxymethylglutaryl-CoA lyase n=1 Tax=Aminipila luticellarii TaxID=2507160 RepID=A0A410PTV6_9FIRM|nr:hydroxymethylglutaryl-CoA lyase [Aminipila luticellarii]QAT42344.1 hydroxymethylglutaryl-CoA lyase [Aminipila luticellarii]
MKLNLPKKLQIIDVTLRDGLQNEERYIPLEAKLYIADKLIQAGFKKIEVGSLSHIKYVPQFKDIDELLKRLPPRDDVEYTVLALTKKACERAADLVNQGVKIDRVLTGQIATSEAYALKNMRRTHDELFKEAEINIKILHDAGIKKVFGNIGTIFGCPIQGSVPIEKAYEFMDRMFSIGFDEIEHSDPDGKATPIEIMEYFQTVLSKYPDPSLHSFHIHDIRGTGIAGYLTAMQAGITTFDVSIGGIGGQVANFMDGVPVPGSGDYYFDSRRTGLVSTEDFTTMVNEMNIETGIDHQQLYRLGMTLEKILGRPLYSFTSSTTNTYIQG